MRDPMPTAAQARMLLKALMLGHVPWKTDRLALIVAIGQGWIDGYPMVLTPAGRDALARYLLRTYRGPVVVVEEQPGMVVAEVPVMLAIVAEYDVDTVATAAMLLMLRGCSWIEAAHGWVWATDEGREALISYLLRDFNA